MASQEPVHPAVAPAVGRRNALRSARVRVHVRFTSLPFSDCPVYPDAFWLKQKSPKKPSASIPHLCRSRLTSIHANVSKQISPFLEFLSLWIKRTTRVFFFNSLSISQAREVVKVVSASKCYPWECLQMISAYSEHAIQLTRLTSKELS